MTHAAVLRPALLALLVAGAGSASAYQLYATDDTHLNADLSATFGLFHSQERYTMSGTLDEGSSSWQEGFVKYGLSGDQKLGGTGTAYGAFNLLSSATWGDGDAAGFSDGSERTTRIEDAYAGWRSAGLFPVLGEDGIDLSFGRQNIVVGDGFLIDGDALNLGKGVADGEFNRGGAYYLAGRRAFDETAVLRIGGKEGWRGDLMRLKSDNRAQAKSELYVATLEHVAQAGTVGLTYIDVNDIDEQYASPAQLARQDMKTYSLRGTGNAGVENLFLSGEYAWQDKRHTDNGASSDENAWYLEAGWTFSDVAWKPYVSYRFSRFSEGYDPLFYGFSRGFGTWFQGEVAGNYAGPFNSNTRVHNIGAKVSPLENVSVGLQWFDFHTLDTDLGNTDANELDLYAEWAVNEHLMIIPLVGLYQPKKSAAEGGTQLGNDNSNLYSQLLFSTTF
ncbi:alginate export family protein [Pseudomonas sp. GCEP-101]|uniref:alginate export family protein n=1 Tax=Pseudomonas sp. GCEP-101 TaxID=2974552 RepID=UPI00223AC106|nr:alginate export family protein [Pseudomonas sp. GCEP-101]